MAKSTLNWGDTPAEQQLLIGPMISLVAGESSDRQSNTLAVAKIAIIRENVGIIIQKAAQSSVLGILQGAYTQKEAGKWTLVGENIQVVRDFVKKMLQEIQFPTRESIKATSPANEEQYKEAA